jgi:hypothetical protein
MVTAIALGVFNHSDADTAELSGMPVSYSSLTWMFGTVNLIPVDSTERDI